MKQCRVCGNDLTILNSNISRQRNRIYICEKCRKREAYSYLYKKEVGRKYRLKHPNKNSDYYQGNKRIIKEKALFKKTVNTSCICLFCGELDFRCLQEHHPNKKELPNFTITLCANCHAKMHWNLGHRKL